MRADGEEGTALLELRLRLGSLWLSQLTRGLADWCLRLVALHQLAGLVAGWNDRSWHVATAVFVAPFILLAPLNGCISNDLPRRGVLVGSSLLALLVVVGFALGGGWWMVCLGLVAVASAVHSAARFAMYPAAAQDTHWPLSRVNGWMELAGAVAIIGGMALGVILPAPDWPSSGAPLNTLTLAVLIGLNAVCLLTALPVVFPSDTRRHEPPLQAVAGFFRDLRRTFAIRAAGGSLLSLAAFQALVVAATGALLARFLKQNTDYLFKAMTMAGVGAALGCLTTTLQPHRERNLGFVPLGAVGLILALVWAWRVEGTDAILAPCVLLGFCGSLVNVPLRTRYLSAVPADARGNAMAVMNAVIYIAMLVLSLAVVSLLPGAAAQLICLAVLAGLGAVLAWYVLLTEVMEMITEACLIPMYRVRTYGPGLEHVPEGPLLIIANHAAYLDPFWLAKMLPRHVTPMMTSVFFDLPGIRWMMVHVVGAIRVPYSTFRREAPELREVVAALRRGQAVLIFPEAYLRRRDDQLLRLFGQGMWRILQELPETPILPCWIEGGWGSFTSYRNGAPLKNKWPDWRRPIDIAIADPQTIPPDILADRSATRLYLMRLCLECRRYLGLPVPEGQDFHAEGHEEASDAEAAAHGQGSAQA